jgi:5-methylcytosine-specific restriction protein A
MFEPGKVYQRETLHLEWNGERRLQPQGGILTPRGEKFIVLITGQRGQKYGYDDEWKNGVFEYFGAGQDGDMEWVRGNAAVRDSGKDLYLFEEVEDGLRYRCQLDYGGYRIRPNIRDRKGNPRKAIVFLLTKHGDEAGAPPGRPRRGKGRADRRWSMDLKELRKRAQKNRRPAEKVATAPRAIYERSEDLRVLVLRRAKGICEGCGTEGPFKTKSRPERPYLEPHHTERLSDGGPDIPAHVIALCPSCHRRVHHGADGENYNRTLKSKLKKLEP